MDENGHLISDSDIEFIKKKILDLQYQPIQKFERNIKVVGYLNYLFKKIALQPIIVGGHAIELYTAGHYTTVDVDLVVSGYDSAKKVFEKIGFVKRPEERHWYHKELALPIEIPDNILCGSMDKTIEVTFEENYSVYVIGIEDLIMDRVRAAVYWDSSSDRQWALLLMNAQWNDIDFGYLKKEAENESKKEQNHGVYETVVSLIKEAEKIKKETET